MYCPNCGSKIPDGSKFCENCGAKITPAPVTPQPEAPTPQPEPTSATPVPDAVPVPPVPSVPPVTPTDNVSPVPPIPSTANIPPVPPMSGIAPMPEGPQESNEKKKSGHTPIIVAAIAAVVVIAASVCFFVFRTPTSINLDDYLIAEFSGYNGYGTATFSFDLDGIEKKYEKALAKNLEKNGVINNAYLTATAYFMNSCVNGETDNTTDLSNGEEAVYIYHCDDELAQETFGLELEHPDKSYWEAYGLEDLTEFDPFQYTTVTFSGMSPNATANVEKASTPEYMSSVGYDYKGSGLADGDVFTLNIKNSCLDILGRDYGLTPSSIAKTYTVDTEGTCITSFSQIPSSTFTEMQTKAAEKVSNITVSPVDSKEIADSQYLGYYFYAGKDNTAKPFNKCYLIYEAVVEFTSNNMPGIDSVYTYVVFNDIGLKKSDSSCFVDLDSAKISSSNTRSFGSSQISWAGYESLSLLEAALQNENGSYNGTSDVTDTDLLTTYIEENREELTSKGIIVPDDALNLYYTEPVDSFLYKTTTTATVPNGSSWDNVILLNGGRSGYAIYNLGRQYHYLTLTCGPEYGMAADIHGTVEVYGDDDLLLWSSSLITYLSDPQTATIDISGQNSIILVAHNLPEPLRDYTPEILIKDVMVWGESDPSTAKKSNTAFDIPEGAYTFPELDVTRGRTTADGLWQEVISLTGLSNAKTLNLAGQYNYLTFTFAKNRSTYDSSLTVIGDNDVVLYESGPLTEDTKAKTVTVDVSGQYYVTIKASRGTNSSSGVYIKNLCAY